MSEVLGPTPEVRRLKPVLPMSNQIFLRSVVGSSIHPSTGSASAGRPFCQRLKRNRSRGRDRYGIRVFAAVGAEVTGVASNHSSGSLNSKFRTSATAT